MPQRIKLQKKNKVNPYDKGFSDGYDKAMEDAESVYIEAAADSKVTIAELGAKVIYEQNRWKAYSAKYQRLHTNYLALTTKKQRDNLSSIATTIPLGSSSAPMEKDQFDGNLQTGYENLMVKYADLKHEHKMLIDKIREEETSRAPWN